MYYTFSTSILLAKAPTFTDEAESVNTNKLLSKPVFTPFVDHFVILSSADFSPMIYDRHCHEVHSSLTAHHWLGDAYLGKQPVNSEEFCAMDC